VVKLPQQELVGRRYTQHESTVTTIHQIRLSISNAFLIQGDRTVIVDTGSPKDGDKLLAALGKHGVQRNDLSMILLTHGHSDHCGSTRQLVEATSAPTAIHPSDAAALEDGQNPTTQPTCLTAKLLHWLVDDKFPGIRPDILLPDDMDLQGLGIDGKVVHTPGHTAGSVSLVLASGQAIVGDLLMGGWLGGMLRSGRPGYPYYADDLGQLRGSMVRLLDMGVKRFHVGHGGPIEAERVKEWLGRVGGG
jgi:glyoxylase-like metal-dependent hydrolase (beta-lactamase superfamily II)